MANWRQKRIEDVQIGDKVMGWTYGVSPTKRAVGKLRYKRMGASKVIGKGVKHAKVYKLTMQSGREVYCTKDHRWYFGNHFEGTRAPYVAKEVYAPVKVGAKTRGALLPVYEVPKEPTPKEQRMLDWLGGLIDGEGACRHGPIHIYQSETVNSEVCDEIDRVLRKLDIQHTKSKRTSYSRDGRKTGKGWCWTLRGGRSMKVRLLNHARMRKRKQVLARMAVRRLVEGKPDRIVSMESVGRMPVYWLQTETGNYVVWGYASSNSQYRQSPVPPGGAMFDVDKVQVGVPGPMARVARFWDKATTAKKGAAYTAGVLMGVDGDGRYWVLDVVRGRWNSYDREKKVSDTADADPDSTEIGIEQEPGSGGKNQAEDGVRRLAGFRVRVVKSDASTGGKERRAEPFSAQVNGGNVFLAAAGKDRWHKDYLAELRAFPFSKYKDQVDASSGAFSMVHRRRMRAGACRSKGRVTRTVTV